MFFSKHQFIAPELTRLVSIVVFLVFASTGIWIGHQVRRQIAFDGRLSIENRDRIERSPGVEQTNILVIITNERTVDSLQLLTTWLVIYLPRTTEVIFLPVLPQVKGDRGNSGKKLEDYFSVDKKGVPGKSFFDALDKNYQWDHFIVIDEETLRDFIDALGGVFINGRTQSGHQTLETLEKIDQDPALLLLNQSATINSVCHKLAISNRSVLKKLVDQSVMDADLLSKIAKWVNGMDGNHTLKCEFPALMDLLN
jgi:hypothetical protein